MGEIPPGTKLVIVSREFMVTALLASPRGNRLSIDWGEPTPEGWHVPVITEHYDQPIPAIAEARAQALADARREVEALPRDRGDDEWDTVARPEVLAALDRLSGAAPREGEG